MSQCYNKFYKYSFLNMVLVLMQTGKLEPVATFKKWVSLGRKVISGPGSALFVNHPRFAPRKDPNTGKPIVKNGKVEMKFIGAYPKATVFQLFQTEGPDIEMADLPEWDKAQAMAELDITETKFQHDDGNCQGYSVDRRFALNPANCESPFKTMVHEWAHILGGHTVGGYKEHPRDIAEFLAEAVALLVCHELDVEAFDAASSRGYIQGWLKGKTADYLDNNGQLLVTDSVVREIFSITDRILVAGRKKHYDKLVEPSLF
jgi:antirestriction protein ArdC